MTRYTKGMLIEQIQWMTQELGRVPKKREFETCPLTASCSTIDNHFGSWNNYLQESGIRRDVEYRQKITDKELIGQVRRMSEELGRTPTAKEYDMCEYTSAVFTITVRFGGWGQFIDAAGLQRNKIGRMKRITADELIRQVQQLAADLGRAPTAVQFNECRYVSSANAAKSRFGSWSKFLIAAGLTPNNRGRKRKPKEECTDDAED